MPCFRYKEYVHVEWWHDGYRCGVYQKSYQDASALMAHIHRHYGVMEFFINRRE